MSNIIQQNNIRYQIDNLFTTCNGLLVSKAGSEIDFTKYSQVNKIILDYSQPSGTEIYIAFSHDNIWYKLNSSGNLTQIFSGNPSFDLLKSFGNIPAELTALNDIPGFVNKKIGLAVALATSNPQEYIPRIKFSFNVQNSTQLLTFSELSPVYELAENSRIDSASFSHENSGTGTVNLYAQITRPDNSKSGWLELPALTGLNANSIQFKADYSVQSVNNGIAKIQNVKCVYSTGGQITSGVSSGEIISLTQDWYMNIKQSRMTIKHKPLVNANLDAYIALRQRPKVIFAEILGYGTGTRKTFELAHKDGIKYDTIKLYYDYQRVYSDFDFNTQAGKITCEAPEGVLVSCDYNYGWTSETWQKMSLASRYEIDGQEISEFRFASSDGDNSVCAVKIVLSMTEGKINGETIGIGTGKIQTYKLKRRVKDGEIKIFTGGGALSTKNYFMTDVPQIIKIAASAGAVLTANYSWISETPEVYQFAAVFGE